MSEPKKFDLDPETLLYDLSSEPLLRRLVRYGLLFLASLALALLYFWILFGVLGIDTPKTAILKSRNEGWTARMAVMNRDLDRCEETLRDLEMRGGDVYRSIFGMSRLPSGRTWRSAGTRRRWKRSAGTACCGTPGCGWTA